tara:strand:- start:149 stop:676 length:528 start_codon:yes stop_codon:yes gene_type:complete
MTTLVTAIITAGKTAATWAVANPGLALSGISTAAVLGAQNKGARQQEQLYDEQAAQARLQGRTDAINYKQQGANVLKKMNEILATTIARSGQFGDAALGSSLSLQRFAESEASMEFGTAIDNSQLALAGAEAQANIYRQSGQIARTTGQIQMAGTLSSGLNRMLSLRPGKTEKTE